MKQMLLPFKLGLGGTVGNGSQAFSWIHLEDLVNAYLIALDDKEFKGIYNLTSPSPSTNRGLTKALGKALKRPTIFPIPEFALKIKFGEGSQILTKGQRVFPKRLLENDFHFIYDKIDETVKSCI